MIWQLVLVLSASAWAQNPYSINIHGPKDESFLAMDKMVGREAMAAPEALRAGLSEDCAPGVLEEQLRNSPPLSAPDFSQRFSQYLNRCEAQLAQGGSSGVTALLKINSIDYDFFDSPNVQRFEWVSPLNEKVRGILHIKPGRRPMVIMRCGLFCNASQGPANNMMLSHLANETPFHVLILSSHSGEDSIQDNSRISFSGFVEGQENIWVGQWLLQDSPYREQIDSLHLLGVSLGGHSALYTALYGSYPENKSPFKSHLAYCPVVNLEPTVQDMFSGLKGGFSSSMAWKIIKKMYDKVPILKKIVDPFRPPLSEEYPQILALAGLDYLQSLDSSRFPAPFLEVRYQDQQSFWSQNKFLNFAHLSHSNLLYWAAQDDPIVNPQINAMTLTDNNIAGFVTPRGSHCGLSVSYGWKTASTFLRSYFMNFSGDFRNRFTRHEAPIKAHLQGLGTREVHSNQKWQAFEGSSDLRLELSIFKGRSPSCFAYTSSGESRCFRRDRVRLPLSDFGLPKPQNKVHAQEITRWANSQLILKRGGRGINGRRENPDRVEWISY